MTTLCAQAALGAPFSSCRTDTMMVSEGWTVGPDVLGVKADDSASLFPHLQNRNIDSGLICRVAVRDA